MQNGLPWQAPAGVAPQDEGLHREAPIRGHVESRAHPRIRTFIPRRGRVSPTVSSALTRLLPVWGIDAEHPPANLADAFGSPDGPPPRVVLEIGSGMGEATAAMALADPQTCIVAVDVHTPGIGALLATSERLGLGNVRVYVGDAVELMDRLAPATLAGIRVYFPDPWPKLRHHKRRLVQPPFVHRAAQLLQPGGTLHLATDIAEYAAQMIAVCGSEPMLDCSRGLQGRPGWRPTTGFEARAAAAGRVCRDLIAVRV